VIVEISLSTMNYDIRFVMGSTLVDTVVGKMGRCRVVRTPPLSGFEYITELMITNEAPILNQNVGTKSDMNADMMHEKTMEKDVANTLRTLSANFTTTATINPPTA
jgi:hypothetical protein